MKKGKYGRYIEYRYSLEERYINMKTQVWDWLVQADCEDYTANWDKDSDGWYKVRDPDMYLRPGRFEMKEKYPSAKEAKTVLDEFCPKIESIPKSGREVK